MNLFSNVNIIRFSLPNPKNNAIFGFTKIKEGLLMFDEKDLEQFKKKGTNAENVKAQLELIKNGFPFLELESAASIGNGIMAIDESQCESYIKTWDTYCSKGRKITKFVPASGAASRMFKDLFGFLDASYDVPTTPFEKSFFDGIEKFAFYNDLDECCKANEGKSVRELMAGGCYKAVVSNLLESKGLNYGALPKGVLKFHKYSTSARTPLEEHMAEGAMYASGEDGVVHLHFTVSNEHRDIFRNLAQSCAKSLSKRYGTTFDITFSEQKPSTDTVAAAADGGPFRNDDGSILFRPGGHGALIENLNDLDTDIVFIKNIDNVVPDHLKTDTVIYKKLLAGILVTAQSKIFDYLRLLDSGKYTQAQLKQISDYVSKTLCCRNKEIDKLDDKQLAAWLHIKLDRPLRVCGMVKNVGEPGGGPFLAYNSDGTVSPQILESSQIDLNDARKKEMFTHGTHFNPVDLVCALRGYKGGKFDLPKHVDPATGFISSKSKNGRELKALELPGLWNGAMSDWNTIFVEVPLTTFNPVKTVNDLLRPQHQPA